MVSFFKLKASKSSVGTAYQSTIPFILFRPDLFTVDSILYHVYFAVIFLSIIQIFGL